MAIISVSGDPGCAHEDLARAIAQRAGCELVTRRVLEEMIAADFGNQEIPDRAWPPLLRSAIGRLAVDRHVVYSLEGGERLFHGFPSVLRVLLIAPPARRIGAVMVEQQLDRETAKRFLRQRELEVLAERKRRFGRSHSRLHEFDLILNDHQQSPEMLASVVEAAIQSRGLLDQGMLSAAAEAQVQFQARLQLAKFGLTPPDRVPPERNGFGHPSEEIFARLLDFYRIEWQYEPRSFPLQWDKDGHVMEAFTPDFFLPAFDLYVELTTMKQALVTRKNRKIRLLRTIYPHVNIQVFYQKDIQDLIVKYELAERASAH
ncbi:MAG: cytidylate kinase family protein [Bryobacteraceae bacterium]|jgi:cytidylate kinase